MSNKQNGAEQSGGLVSVPREDTEEGQGEEDERHHQELPADCTNLSCPSLFLATLPDSLTEPLLVLCRGDDAIL